MLTILPQNSLLQYFCWFSSIYVATKIFLTLYYLISVYLVPRLKKHEDFTKYGQWAVITGSTDGIGKGFAEQLAGKGVDICLISRNEERLQNTAKQLETQYGVKTRYIVADFTDPNIYDHIEKNLDGLDIGILVNNVGIMADHVEPFIEQDKQHFKNSIYVNTLSTVLMTSIIAPIMIAKKRGLIINLSSVVGVGFMPYLTMYSATKVFIKIFSQCLSEELKCHNIQVIALTPSIIRTNMSDKHAIGRYLLNCLPRGVISVKEYMESALIAITSGHSVMTGHLIHNIYEIILKGSPMFFRRYIMEFVMYQRRKSK